MENKGLTVVLGVIVAVGLIFVYANENPQSLPNLGGLFGSESALPDEGFDTSGSENLEEDQAEEAVGGWIPHEGVSASHPLAVEVGMEVMERGGTAVDAAIAVSYVLGVVEPFGSGIGGGGTMLVQELNGSPVAYNYRETTPQSGQIHSLGIGVPGFVKGMEEAHNDFGTIPMEELIDYAIELALPEGQTLEVGGGTDVLEGKRVDVTQILHNRLEAAAYRMPIYDERFDISHFYPGEQAILPGQELVQPQLAETLSIIRDYGADGFYNPDLEGSIGHALVEEIPEFEPEDFTTYEVDETEPIHGEFAGYDVYSAPAPMSGITLIQILQLVEAMADHGVDITQFEPDSPEFINLIIAATRHAYKERNDLVGDPHYVDVPIEEMTSKAYADVVAEFMVNDEKSYFNRGSQIDTDPVEIEGAWGDDITTHTDGLERDHKLDTTHFVVVDKDGTMVSATNTLSNFFGSGYYVGGFFLNDQLSNFAADNPASPNYPEPGKRSRSFISPTIISNEEGHPVLGIGSPGGSRIPAVTAQVIILWAMMDTELRDAISAPRFFYEDGVVSMEEEIPAETVSALQQEGYDTRVFNHLTGYGNISALIYDEKRQRLYFEGDERRQSTGAQRKVE